MEREARCEPPPPSQALVVRSRSQVVCSQPWLVSPHSFFTLIFFLGRNGGRGGGGGSLKQVSLSDIHSYGVWYSDNRDKRRVYPQPSILVFQQSNNSMSVSPGEIHSSVISHLYGGNNDRICFFQRNTQQNIACTPIFCQPHDHHNSSSLQC